MVVDELFKAYPSNHTTLRLIQSGRTVPLRSPRKYDYEVLILFINDRLVQFQSGAIG
jgi:hypothetical protein